MGRGVGVGVGVGSCTKGERGVGVGVLLPVEGRVEICVCKSITKELVAALAERKVDLKYKALS